MLISTDYKVQRILKKITPDSFYCLILLYVNATIILQYLDDFLVTHIIFSASFYQSKYIFCLFCLLMVKIKCFSQFVLKSSYGFFVSFYYQVNKTNQNNFE